MEQVRLFVRMARPSTPVRRAVTCQPAISASILVWEVQPRQRSKLFGLQEPGQQLKDVPVDRFMEIDEPNGQKPGRDSKSGRVPHLRVRVRTSWKRRWVPQVPDFETGVSPRRCRKAKLENSNFEKALGTDATP